jgi:Xaa-Pro aminopeptidase
LLIDAGCEYAYYASDVTRTFPVGGRFSDPQRRLFDLVLSAQTAGIDAVRPGVTLDDIHQRTLTILTEGMIDLGLIEGPLYDAIKEERYKRCYMHKTSHYLGMDVHDVGAYFIDKKPRPLEAGVVITVEPGLYVAPDDMKAPSEYRGIGIRIEDDILVTADGHRVLSDGLPRTASEIELLCSS